MKAAPTLLPVLRSQTQGELLASLYLDPDREFSLTTLARRLGVSVPTVMREVDRLAGGGLVLERREGNLRLVRARRDTALFQPLAQLLALTYGPVPVLSDLLGGVPGVEEAYVFGSWAARYDQSPGAAPRDVDVVVVGNADADALDEVADAAQSRLGLPVDVVQVDRTRWTTDTDDPFLVTVRSRPLVRLDLDPVPDSGPADGGG